MQRHSQHRSTALALGLVTATLLTGCVAGPAALPEEFAWVLDDAEPITVTPVLDESTATTALVTIADGGVVTATGADGTVYTLTVPPEAVRFDVEITMTPLLSIDGLPFGGDGSALAVQLEPSGLALDAFASLDIESPQAPPASERVLFGYQGAGEALTLALPDLESDGIRIRLDHFSGYGVGNGFLTDIAAIGARLGGSADDRIAAAVAEAVQRHKQTGEPLDILPFYEVWEEQVLKPRLDRAGASCGNSILAIETALGYERNRQLMGDSDFRVDVGGMGGALIAGSRLCLEEEYSLCKINHVVHRMMPIWLGFDRAAQLLGQDPEYVAFVAEAEQKVRDCLTFSIEFLSTASESDGDFSVVSSVTATTELTFDTRTLKYTSPTVPLRNTALELALEGCSYAVTLGDGTFAISDMVLKPGEFDISPPDDGTDPRVGKIEEIEVLLSLGNTTESAIQTCFGFSDPLPPMPLWTAVAASASGPSFGVLTEWQIAGGAEFARMQWNRSTGAAVDAGAAILNHTPK